MSPYHPLRCNQARAQFSSYLDGAVNGLAMQAISRHFDSCTGCRDEFADWRAMQTSLALLGPAKAPAHLTQRIRAAIAAERARGQNTSLAYLRSFGAISSTGFVASLTRFCTRPIWQTFAPLWKDSIGPIVYRAAGGMASSAVLLGAGALLLGALSTPTSLVADDEPTGSDISPRYLYSSVQPQTLNMDHDGTLLVEAYVDPEGHIYDYRIVSGPDTPAIRTTINDRLLFSVYQPAEFFGQPVRGRVLISFAGISVHG